MWTTRVRTVVLFAACLSLAGLGWALLHLRNPAPPAAPPARVVTVTASPRPGPHGPPGPPGPPGSPGATGVRTVYLTAPPTPAPTPSVTLSPSRSPHPTPTRPPPSSTCLLPPPVPCVGAPTPTSPGRTHRPYPSGMTAPRTDALQGSARTTTQTGTFGLVLGALLAFNVLHLTPEQVAATMPLGAGLVCFLQRLVENRLGWGFLRTVPPAPKRRRRRRVAA